jgi:hypothetical protein
MKEIGSEFSYNDKKNIYFKEFIDTHSKSQFFRCGRDILKHLADKYSEKGGVKSILMPTYSCDSMYNPFFIYNWNVVFYPLYDDLTPNIEFIEECIKSNKVDAILLMDFFGFTDVNTLIGKVKQMKNDILIIEDVTHRIFNIGNNSNVDFYVGSIRKWLGIPDGALLYSDKFDMPNNLDVTETLFVSLRSKALDLKLKYSHSADPKLKEDYRELMSCAETSIAEGQLYYKISEKSLDYLNNLDVSTLKIARKKNFNYLYNMVKDISEISFPLNIEKLLSNEIIPFSLPVLVDNRDDIQKKLAKRNLFAPLLWPLNNSSRKLCSVSANLENKMLSIPIDQRYDFSDMNLIYDRLIDILK